MGTSVDYFPDGALQMTARAQPSSGNPLRLEFQDGGKHVADFTIFTRSPAIAVRLEHAINFVMRSKDGPVTRDAIEEMIGDNGDVAFEAVVNERDRLYWHVTDLIGLVNLARSTLDTEQQQVINENPRLIEALKYMATIAPPTLAPHERTAPEVAEVLNAATYRKP